MHSVDSRSVTRELRRVVGKTLRANGFVTSSGRNYWRILPDRIDVVCFQSFNSYHASGLNCTTHSFAVRLGFHPLCVPPQQPWRARLKSVAVPQEYECGLRGTLLRPFQQDEIARRDIWYVGPEGQHLQRVVEAAEALLREEGLPWFARLSDHQELLRTLLEDDPSEHTGGFGGNPCPQRDYLTAYVALALGDRVLARERLVRVKSSGCFPWVRANVERDLRACS